MWRSHNIFHIVLQECLDRVDSEHHHQPCEEHPGKIGVAPGLEVEHAQQTQCSDDLQDNLLYIVAKAQSRYMQCVPGRHNTPGNCYRQDCTRDIECGDAREPGTFLIPLWNIGILTDCSHRDQHKHQHNGHNDTICQPELMLIDGQWLFGINELAGHNNASNGPTDQ